MSDTIKGLTAEIRPFRYPAAKARGSNKKYNEL